MRRARFAAPRPVLFAALVAAPLAADLPAQAAPWVMDRTETSVTFSLAHVGFAMVEGRFDDFDARIDYDPQSQKASSVAFTIKAASVDTDWSARDDFIRGDDMLDVAKFPTITFVSSEVTMLSDTRATVTGLVTIKGVSRVESFDVKLSGMGPSAANPNSTVADFVVTGEIQRSDYGVGGFAPAVSDTMALRVELAASPAR